ncbi:MAG: carboxymuconolactone decarboxylase family protein, partial [Gammaproteobacteria bacterium]|nr:carboxymuconolactone decarboxylase family protein [Gammaproteobacteria bacterium]
EQAVVDLTIAINAINSWNRIAKTFKPEVGSYKSQ